MTLKIVLFLHVLAAIALLGPTFVLPLVHRVTSMPIPLAVLRVMWVIERMVTLFIVVQAVTGAWLIWLAHINDHFGAAKWLHVSILLFVMAAGVGSGFNMPRLRRAIELTERGDDAGAARVLEPVERVAGPILGVLAVVIVFLMVYRPWQG